jgi:hypothetical protein
MNRLIEEGIVDDSCDKCLESLTELSARLPQQLGPYVGPRHGGFGIRDVLGPTLIELGTLLVREFELGRAFAVREALPQRERDLGPVPRWKLEEVS